MLSKEHALRVNALAQTNRGTAQQYAIELITRALESILPDCFFERLSLLASQRRATWPREAIRPTDPVVVHRRSQKMNWIPTTKLGIPQEKVYAFHNGGRPLFIRLALLDAERLEARARKHGLSATELMRRIIKQHLDGDDWRPSDM
jgi:hypothetical protein